MIIIKLFENLLVALVSCLYGCFIKPNSNNWTIYFWQRWKKYFIFDYGSAVIQFLLHSLALSSRFNRRMIFSGFVFAKNKNKYLTELLKFCYI